MRRTQRSLVDSPHKGPVIWQACLFHKFIVYFLPDTLCHDLPFLLVRVIRLAVIEPRPSDFLFPLKNLLLLVIGLPWCDKPSANGIQVRYHYKDVTMGAMASQVTSLAIVYSTVYSGADQRKHQLSASLAFVRGIHRWPVISPHKWPVARYMFPFDDVIMISLWSNQVVVPWNTDHDMETFSSLLALYEGNPTFAGGFSSQRVDNTKLF